MVEEDQAMRREKKFDPEVDRENTERIKEIIREYGWPGEALIGKEGAHGAWLLVQHADHDPKFQEEALSLLEDAVAQGEAEKQDLGYLIDRVRVNSETSQLFGTQFRPNEGGYEPFPIEDPEHLDERRKEYGMKPFAEYEATMQRIIKERREKK